MKNTNAVMTVANLTLSEAVVEAVKELKINGKFTAHEVTEAVRAAANEGEIALPGLEAKPNGANIKYWVNHEDVKRVLDNLIDNGELANLGLTNVDYSGQYRVFEFGTPTPTTPAAAVQTNANVAAGAGPVAQKIQAYITKVGTATLKQIQSALKVNGITCEDLAEMVEGLGYTVTPGTNNCYSTYTVSA